VDRRLARSLAAFERRDTRKPGRPRREDGLRSEGMRYELRLTQRTALALDHIRTVMGIDGAASAVREAIEECARKVSVRTEIPSHG
jgi:hypothetical protein